MKYAIISDIHANITAFDAVLEDIAKREVDRLVCLGDVVGYNASPNACADKVRAMNIPTICGNHDAVACSLEEPWGFNPVALAAAVWTRESLTHDNHVWLRGLPDARVHDDFVAVHGSPFDRDFYMFNWEDVLQHMDYLKEVDRKVCFFGHTHTPGIFAADGVYTIDDDAKFQLEPDKEYFINPGSVGQPRDGDPRSAYGLFNSETREYELVRVEYDVAAAQDQILAEGLPEFLAQRLAQGR